MAKGVPNKKYPGEFKQRAVEDMRSNGLSQYEIAEKYGITRSMIQNWERIYLEEGIESLYVERRGRAGKATGAQKGRKPSFDKKIEEDLIAENQRLRAENDYLKKLNALVQEEERKNRNRR